MNCICATCVIGIDRSVPAIVRVPSAKKMSAASAAMKCTAKHLHGFADFGNYSTDDLSSRRRLSSLEGQTRRRDFIKVITGTAAAWPLATHAQQAAPNIPRIGILALSTARRGRGPAGVARAWLYRGTEH